MLTNSQLNTLIAILVHKYGMDGKAVYITLEDVYGTPNTFVHYLKMDDQDCLKIELIDEEPKPKKPVLKVVK